MVQIDDIVDRCASLERKYHLGVEGLRDLKDLAMLTIQHCQDRISQPTQPEFESPYEKPWGGHQ